LHSVALQMLFLPSWAPKSQAAAKRRPHTLLETSDIREFKLAIMVKNWKHASPAARIIIPNEIINMRRQVGTMYHNGSWARDAHGLYTAIAFWCEIYVLAVHIPTMGYRCWVLWFITRNAKKSWSGVVFEVVVLTIRRTVKWRCSNPFQKARQTTRPLFVLQAFRWPVIDYHNTPFFFKNVYSQVPLEPPKYAYKHAVTVKLHPDSRRLLLVPRHGSYAHNRYEQPGSGVWGFCTRSGSQCKSQGSAWGLLWRRRSQKCSGRLFLRIFMQIK